jgi:IclR family acetate operon transcriptional repressor
LSPPENDAISEGIISQRPRASARYRNTVQGFSVIEIDKEASSKQVIARAASVLRALEGNATGLTLADLVRATDLPRSTVQRIVQALQGQQLVAMSAGQVSLGPAITRLAGSTFLDVVSLVRPSIETLARQTRETVNLSVLRGNHAVLVDQVPSDYELRVVSPVGSALPLHCTAHGKALLASMTDNEIDQRMAGPWERRTARTVPTLAALTAQIAEIRRDPIAHELGENLEGVCGIGITLNTRTTERYALSVTIPAVRYLRTRRSAADALKTCAQTIAASFIEKAPD